MRRILCALAVLAFCAAGSGRAHAAGLEFDLSQLGYPQPDTSDKYVEEPNPKDPEKPIRTPVIYDRYAQERFARFATDLAFAITPLPAGLSSTSGDAGLNASLSIDVAFISPRQRFSDGTVLPVWPTVQAAPSSLTMTTLHLRKGLPMSIQVGTDVSWVTGSAMFAPTAWVQWSPLEGLRKIPAVSIRGLTTVLLGTGDLMMVVGGWDVGTSYKIPIRGRMEAGVFLGYQQLGLAASTQNVDFLPAKENAKSPLSDDTVFESLKYGSPLIPTTRLSRIYFGAQLRMSVAVVGFDVAYGTANNDIGGPIPTKYSLTSWKMGFRAGVLF